MGLRVRFLATAAPEVSALPATLRGRPGRRLGRLVTRMPATTRSISAISALSSDGQAPSDSLRKLLVEKVKVEDLA